MWGDKVFVIAEAGVNHNGSVSMAHQLINVAADAGADAVKFQTFDCERLDPPGERREMLRKLQLSYEDHIALKKSANKFGIEFMSTPFDVDSLCFLVDDVGVKTLKIASGNLNNKPLLEAAGESGCKVILSSGMSSMNDIADAAFVIYYAGRLNWNCHFPTVLHCTSAYPTPLKDVNLNAMVAMNVRFQCEPACFVGLSDHTEGIAIPIAAVALGAVVIEKHFTLDRNMDGPDHKASIEPNDLAAMIEGIRQIEEAMGDGEKVPRQSEEFAMGISRDRRSWREGTYVEAGES